MTMLPGQINTVAIIVSHNLYSFSVAFKTNVGTNPNYPIKTLEKNVWCGMIKLEN